MIPCLSLSSFHEYSTEVKPRLKSLGFVFEHDSEKDWKGYFTYVCVLDLYGSYGVVSFADAAHDMRSAGRVLVSSREFFEYAERVLPFSESSEEPTPFYLLSSFYEYGQIKSCLSMVGYTSILDSIELWDKSFNYLCVLNFDSDMGVLSFIKDEGLSSYKNRFEVKSKEDFISFAIHHPFAKAKAEALCRPTAAKSVDWEERRYEIAKEVLASQPIAMVLVKSRCTLEDVVSRSIALADELIKQLQSKTQ